MSGNLQCFSCTFFLVKRSRISARSKMTEVLGVHSQPPFTCPKLTIETLDQGVKYVQSQLWTYFTPCSTVSIVNFEHVIAGWVVYLDLFCNIPDIPRYTWAYSPANFNELIGGKLGLSTRIKTKQVFIVFDWKEDTSVE